jgi:two-component system response regulator FlrC
VQKLSNIVQISEARAIMETLDACGGRRAQAAPPARASASARCAIVSPRSAKAGLAIGGRG